MSSQLSPYIDRKTASKILGVSVRTVDRYIRFGKVWARAENGRIWLDRKEIVRFPRSQADKSKLTIDRAAPFRSTAQAQKTEDGAFYRDLYDEAKHALQDYQQKIEQANYRIGQLESQILHPIVPKFPQEKGDFVSLEILRKELSDREKEINHLKEFARRERTSRIIFSLLAYFFIILLPLMWYLLR